jgi:hypothetical protein
VGEGVRIAARTIDAGLARRTLERFVATSQSLARVAPA